MKDYGYVNGVIAVKEKALFSGERILRLCEMTAEDAFRALVESGFGSGAEGVSSVYDFERLVEADERETDGFIREYAPGYAALSYLLSERDFHNVKAIFKAEYLSSDVEKMLAPEGLIPIADLLRFCREGDYAPLGKYLGGAAGDTAALMHKARENGEAVSGADVGLIFERALHAHLTASCSRHPFLKRMLAEKADKKNILTAFRAQDREEAETLYFEGGTLSKELLARLFHTADKEKRERIFKGTRYEEFARLCFEAERENRPFTEAERLLASAESDYLRERRFELKRSQPFLYYVFRRRAANENVRILCVCLLAGMKEGEIKKRLRNL